MENRPPTPVHTLHKINNSTNSNNQQQQQEVDTKNTGKINSRYVRIVRRKWKQRLSIKQFIARMWIHWRCTRHSYSFPARCTNSFCEMLCLAIFPSCVRLPQSFVHHPFPKLDLSANCSNSSSVPNKFGQIVANNFLSRTFLRIAQKSFFFLSFIPLLRLWYRL